MKILIAGSGPSGIFAALSIKKYHQDYEVILVEKNNDIAPRIKISGNGKCNFGNTNINPSFYNDEKEAKKLLENKDEYFSFYDEVGLNYFHDEEGRIYPLSESSLSVIHALKNLLNKYKVNIITSTSVLEIKENDNQIRVKTNKEEYLVDKCVLAIGGISYDNDKINFNSLIKPLVQEYVPFNPSLTPISTTAFSKKMEGKRVKGVIKLLYKNKAIKEEKGEILFKKDGVSGICVFNISSYLARLHISNYSNYSLMLDLLPSLSEKEIKEYELKDQTFINLLNPEIAEYITFNHLNPKLVKLGIRGLYELKNSQVSSGGVNFNSLNDNYSLRNNKNIYIIGETTNIDGECGGFNIEINALMGIYLGKNL